MAARNTYFTLTKVGSYDHLCPAGSDAHEKESRFWVLLGTASFWLHAGTFKFLINYSFFKLSFTVYCDFFNESSHIQGKQKVIIVVAVSVCYSEMWLIVRDIKYLRRDQCPNYFIKYSVIVLVN